jgi:6-phosphogluconate dehydrogenase
VELGMIGLGRMGGNMAERLRKAGHTVIGFDRSPQSSRDVESLELLVQRLTPPRAVWVMVPAGPPTYETVDALSGLLEADDIVIDGGNSRYTDDIRHAEDLAERLMPIFQTLKPDGDFGFVHAGKVGAGHFAKMVHNGIEYGLMQAYAEGWELLETTELVTDVREVIKSWQSGTVIRSWLLDLAVRALDDDEHLEKLRGFAQDSGEGRWTVQAAVDHAVPLPVITAALYARFASRQDDSPAMKMIAALRNQFGGHPVTAAAGSVEKGADAPGADANGDRGEPEATAR